MPAYPGLMNRVKSKFRLVTVAELWRDVRREMPRQEPKQLSFDEFMVKHESEFAEADDRIEIDSSLPAPTTAMEAYSGATIKSTPFSRRMDELRRWWLVRNTGESAGSQSL